MGKLLTNVKQIGRLWETVTYKHNRNRREILWKQLPTNITEIGEKDCGKQLLTNITEIGEKNCGKQLPTTITEIGEKDCWKLLYENITEIGEERLWEIVTYKHNRNRRERL